MQNNRIKIKSRQFYEVPLVLSSPLSISSGTVNSTDHDVMRSPDGTPFIPGSSVAGAFRDYITGNVRISAAEKLFGYTRGETDSSMSRIFISDISFENAVVSVRDGIELSEYKVTQNNAKYDYEIIETGAEGVLKIEVVLYDSDSELDIDSVNDIVKCFISSVHNGFIRFGFKKNRGLGQFHLKNVDNTLYYRYKEFDFSCGCADEYLHFLTEPEYETVTFQPEQYAENENQIMFNITLKLSGGISIRTYSAKPEEPDFAHITTHDGTAVIPGSSWNGAIRARAFDILKYDLDCRKLVKELEKIWGIADNQFIASQIIFSESRIKNNTCMLQMTRNKINRFDSSTVDSALYTEQTCIGGETNLEIIIKNKQENLWVAGLILLVIRDIENGLLAVGGQTAVGRGIFCGNSDINYKEYTDALKEKMNEVKCS